MRRTTTALALALALGVLGSSSVYACHSDYFNEMFVKLQTMKTDGSLKSDQVKEMFALARSFQKIQQQYNREGKPSSALDPHVKGFVATAAGVLDSNQFKKITGKKKTREQELQYTVNQQTKEIERLRKEIEDLRAIVKEMRDAKK